MNLTKIKFILLFIFIILTGINMLTASNFKSDGLYYDILSEEDRTVAVTYWKLKDGYYYSPYSGNIEIPHKVVYWSKTYSVTRIGRNAFEECTGLKSVTIPNSVTSIGRNAFYGCSGLTSVTIPNSVTSIEDYAFCGCTGLTVVTIPNSVTSIYNGAFEGCTKLQNINTDPDNEYYSSIDGILYNKDASFLIFCPQGKTDVTIPNSVTSIINYAFYGCSSLTSMTIPNSVTLIGNYAFYGCSSLTSMTIPNSVTSIGEHVFQKCSKLGTIYVQSKVPIECSPNFPDNVIKDAILYIPTGTLALYEKVDPWRNFWNIEEMDFGGVEETATDEKEAKISVENGIIRISNAEREAYVEVVDIAGNNVYRGNDTTVSGLANGIYIVKVGTNVKKISL